MMIKGIFQTCLFFASLVLIYSSAEARNERLCEPNQPVSPHIQSQYGIDKALEIYRGKTAPNEVVIPLRNRTQDIQSYLDNAAEGSTIIFEPGFFNLNTTLNIDKSLHIVAQNHWMNSASERTRLINTRLNVTADNVIIEGLEFRYGYKVTPTGNSRDEAIRVQGSQTNIVSNRFIWVGTNSVISDHAGITIQIVGARGTLIENNTFERNHGVAIKTDDHVRETVIRRNNFIKTSSKYWLGPETQFPTAGEVAHLGNALTDVDGNAPEPDSQRTVFERNFIQGWQIEMEMMSIKSNFNIIRDNLAINNGIGSIVVRMGHNNLIERNILINTVEQPLRISGSGNMFRQNFFAARDEGVGPMVAIHRQLRFPNSTYPDCSICFAYLAARLNQIIGNDFVGYGASILWPDIEQQSRFFPVGTVDFVDGDPETEHNVFAQNNIFSANAEGLIADVNTSNAVHEVSSTAQSMSWACADVPNFELQ